MYVINDIDLIREAALDKSLSDWQVRYLITAKDITEESFKKLSNYPDARLVEPFRDFESGSFFDMIRKYFGK